MIKSIKILSATVITILVCASLALCIYADEYTTYDVDDIATVGDYEYCHVTGDYPVTPTGDYLTKSHPHKTAEHRGKCVFTCGDCCYNYLDLAGKIIYIDDNRIYYTGYTIGQLQLTAPDPTGWKNVRAIYGLSYGSSISDPPLVYINDQSVVGSTSSASRFSLPASSAGFTTSSQTALLQSLVDYCQLQGYTRLFGVFAFPQVNASTCGIVALLGTTGSISISESGGSYSIINSGSTISTQPVYLTAYGWRPATSLNIPNGTTAIGTSTSTTGVLSLARLYPVLAAGNQGNPNVYPFTGIGLLPAQQDTAHPYQYSGLTSVASARKTGTLHFDSEISTLYDWLAVRLVYNVANIAVSSDKEYTQEEYDAYGNQMLVAGRNEVLSHPYNPPDWVLFTAEQYAQSRVNGRNDVISNPYNPPEWVLYTQAQIDAAATGGDVVTLDIPSILDAIVASPMTFVSNVFSPFDVVLGISVAGVITLLCVIALIVFALWVIKKIF